MANLNLQTTTPVPTLLTLPAEILIKISQNLCIHCRVPRIGEIPHDEVPTTKSPRRSPHDEVATAIHDQTALANLSASSKHLRAVAQPILFHFFHSLAGQIDTRRCLASFIHTLFHRPDLASSVKSLVLWTPDDDISRIPDEQIDALQIKDEDHTFARAAERLGSWWVGRQYGSLDELQELAIALASRATYVLLQRKFVEGSPAKTWRDWSNWTHPMENLRHVVLVGWRYRWPRAWYYTYHIKEARAFLRHTRNLESLVAVDCGADGVGPFVVSGRDELKALPWDVELPWLRKLSISGENVGVEEVEAIIRHSTVFEDLELFHCQYHLGVEWRRDVLDLGRHLGTAKKTLKRLCYSAFPIKATLRESDVCDEAYELSNSDDDEDYFDPTWHGLAGFKVGFSLKDFSALETLELEQLVLYGPVFEEPDNVESDRSCKLVTTDEFLEKFPPSLMRLRMGCIFYWPIVFRDMLAIAEERARFPKLGSVTLEVRRIPPREEFDCLVETFRKAGIALSICSVVRDPFSRGLLPTRPGFPVRLPEPVSYT
ncbi:hypothetical protein C8A03DRAFT_17811 [Achaetomium macrosporum]|uniref:Uncharacterized protein n=1 Tax=Achaetomium macrosporum TaxID=79813 RepID=A0AAN7C569_9PEZI|nr:hypothetical protein C8A03DRAFT_17811 [Achaetomium macrosporum]